MDILGPDDAGGRDLARASAVRKGIDRPVTRTAAVTQLTIPLRVIDASRSARAEHIRAAFGEAGEVRGSLVHLFSDGADLRERALALTLGGAAAVVLTPRFGPRTLPWWGRRFARWVLPSQEVARAWTAHVPLGRLVVVEPAPGDAPGLAPGETDALAAIYAEVWSMAHPRRRARAVS